MIKYKVVNSIEYSENLTEYIVLKTTKRWWRWYEEYISVYQLKDYGYPFYRSGSSTGLEIYYAIHDYKIACEIEECLSI